MAMTKKCILGAVLASFLLVGCDSEEEIKQQQAFEQYQKNQMMLEAQQQANMAAANQPQQMVSGAQQPVEVEVQVDNNGGGGSSGVGEFATGMILGHMMSGGNSGSTVNNYHSNSQPSRSYNNSKYVNKPSAPTSSYSTKKTNVTGSTYQQRNSGSPISTYKKSSTSSSSYSSPSKRSSSYTSSSSRKSSSSRSSSRRR